MDIKTEYERKLKEPNEAVKVIKQGDWIDYGWTVTAPAGR